MNLLFLNSLGTGEVLFILLVVLLLFGSKSIPSMAKGLGKGMREIQNASNEIKRDIQNSVMDMKREINLPKDFDDKPVHKNPSITQKKEEETTTESNSENKKDEEIV